MISDLSSYRLADFIPFSEEVYTALNAYYNESIWPMPLICVVISLGILFWTARRRQISFRIPSCALSVAWAWGGPRLLSDVFRQHPSSGGAVDLPLPTAGSGLSACRHRNWWIADR